MAGQCVQPFETSVPYLNKNKQKNRGIGFILSQKFMVCVRYL